MTPKQTAPKRKKPMPTDLIKYGEAAELLHVTRRTIERMVLDGRLTKYTRLVNGPGRRPVFVSRAQVERLNETVIEVKPPEE